MRQGEINIKWNISSVHIRISVNGNECRFINVRFRLGCGPKLVWFSFDSKIKSDCCEVLFNIKPQSKLTKMRLYWETVTDSPTNLSELIQNCSIFKILLKNKLDQQLLLKVSNQLLLLITLCKKCFHNLELLLMY